MTTDRAISGRVPQRELISMPEFYRQWLLTLPREQAAEIVGYLDGQQYRDACHSLEAKYPDVWWWFEDPIPFG